MQKVESPRVSVLSSTGPVFTNDNGLVGQVAEAHTLLAGEGVAGGDHQAELLPGIGDRPKV